MTGTEHDTMPTEVCFKARCSECDARVELTADQLRLAVGAGPKSTFYSFTCPDCGEHVRRPAGARIVELLTDGGVQAMRLTLHQGGARRQAGSR
ncbi:hypothetical protein [Allostreptomyces psammosilenae]|uniref:Putative RNA-binding Zn-ribbon protein involved in translation (DUF1610 family) n=1 Tax=Allostreptomyces psammosilenae TaxID=1892865 RepID=A0A852ZR80_9ACTN|nr:hypothetical protein [Allostreptomyces psammosilenae]NYI03997.1 putative RNA-binding Zn-ribbon protein involved in translation (DUF1610 family) [Allostreptomyces psammosilenae]